MGEYLLARRRACQSHAFLGLRYIAAMGVTAWCFWLDEREAHRELRITIAD